MRLVCFDIDGTLLITDGAGRRAIRQALLDVLGTAGPIETFRFDGRTDGEIVLRLAESAGIAVDAALAARVLARYVEHLTGELAKADHRTRVYPGVMALLDALERRADCLLGLLTGNVVDGARLKLKSGGIDPDRFRVGAFGSDAVVRAELPGIARQRAHAIGFVVDGADVVIVGDTPADMQCGRLIGARGIGVGTAAYTAADLLAAGAAAAFADLSDTATVMEAIFER